jgi:hypothetical protein
MQLLDASENGIGLKGEPPSFWLLVVFLKHVDVSASKVLPVRNGLFDPFGLRDLLAEDLQEGRLATANVSFNGEAIVLARGLGVEAEVFHILIQTSR